MAPLDRLMARLDTSGACWPASGSRDTDGYVQFKLKGLARRAHVAAYILMIGPIPPGVCVCHTCDNPPCCNPAHLWLGRIADNNRDRNEKGRSNPLKGEHVATARLTTQSARAIRARYAGGGISMKRLGAAYSVDAVTVWKIVHGITWADA